VSNSKRALLRTVLLLAPLVGTGACKTADPNGVAKEENAITPIDRMIIGQGALYPADTTMRDRLAALNASQAARRQAAWNVVAKVLTPVAIAAPSLEGGSPLVAGSLPRFQTWYSVEDIVPMFDHLLRGLSPDDIRAHTPFSQDQIGGIFEWNATMATTLASWMAQRYAQRIAELGDDNGVHSLGKVTRALANPAVVEHILGNYDRILACMHDIAPADRVPADPTNFSTCFRAEMPPDAVDVKVRWMPTQTPMPTFDTSAASLRQKLAAGAWGDGDARADPDASAIYTMRLSPTEGMRLAGLHIVTKELRDWLWITLWWSPDPNTDFGADRPASITALGGPWSHYKMCVVTSYNEEDPDPRGGASDPSLGDATAAAREFGPPSWCSNPYIELESRNATTNCIGCHQHGGTMLSTSAILGDATSFPDNSRSKLRVNFPADYIWALTGSMDLANAMRTKVDALSGP
jgi:hypothetical protein